MNEKSSKKQFKIKTNMSSENCQIRIMNGPSESWIETRRSYGYISDILLEIVLCGSYGYISDIFFGNFSQQI